MIIPKRAFLLIIIAFSNLFLLNNSLVYGHSASIVMQRDTSVVEQRGVEDSVITENEINVSSKKLQEIKKKILNYLSEEKYTEVVSSLGSVIRDNPYDAELNYFVAYAKEKLGSFKNALYSYSNAIDLNEKYFDALFARARVYKKLSFFRKAIIDYTRAYEIMPNDDILFKRASVKMETGDYEGAISDIATIKDENIHGEHELAGRIYFVQENFEEAKKEFYFVFKNEQENDSIYSIFLETLLRLEQYEEILTVCKDIYFKSPKVQEIEALAMFKLKKYEPAVDAYKQLLYTNPNIERYNALAKLYIETGDTAAAMENFDKSLKLIPFQPQVHLDLGLIFMSDKKYRDALRSFNKAIELKKQDYLLYQKRGITLFFLKNYKRAEKDFLRALKYKATDENAITGFTYSNIMLKRYKKALKISANAIKKFPDNGLFYILKAKVYLELHKPEEALKLITKSESKKNARKSPLYLIKSNYYLDTKNYSKALKNINEVIDNEGFGEEIFFYDDHLLLLKAEILFKLKDYLGAIDLYNKILSSNVLDKEDVNYEIGKCYFKLSRYTDALNYYHSVVRDNPYNVDALVSRAACYYKLRRFDKSEENLYRALGITQEHMRMFNLFAAVLLEQNKTKVFNKLFKKYYGRMKDKRNKLFLLAMLRIYQRKFDKAISNLKTIVTKDDEDQTNLYIQEALGICYVNKREFEKSIEYFDKALEISPDNGDVLYHKAEAFFGSGDYKKTIKLLNVILKTNKTPNAYLLRAESYMKSDDKKNACIDFRKSGEMGNKKAYSMLILYCN